MNFFRRLVKSYSIEKLLIDPTPTAAEAVALTVDELELPDVNLHGNSSTADIAMPAEPEIWKVKMDMKDEFVDGGLHDVPVFIDKVARKEAKKKRRKEARLERQKQVLERKRKRKEGDGGGAERPRKRPRDEDSNDATVPAWVHHKRRKAEKRKLKAEAKEKEAAHPSTRFLTISGA